MARLTESVHNLMASLGLLVLRVGFGLMIAIGHGWPKLAKWSDTVKNIGDPIGIGSTVSAALAVGAELFCALAVVLGLLTRLTAIPVAITMAVAAFLVHGADPWFLPALPSREPALLYFIAFAALIFTGGGRFSVDHMLWGRVKTPPK